MMDDLVQSQDGVAAERGGALNPQARHAIWGAALGFFVDNYDIFLPVIALAPAIAYFIPPDVPPGIAAVASAMIFATTLIGRPLGAFIFGHFADTVGRKRTTIISVMGFGFVTLLIAVLPGYQTLGPSVIWIFIGLRLVDGIFLGGEYTSANPLAMEYCPKEKRGFYGAMIQSAAPLGTAGISLVTLAVLLVFPAKGLGSPYVSWGWRIPFFVGALMAFALAYYYKNSVMESEIWRKSEKTEDSSAPLKILFTGENLIIFLQVFVVMTGFWLLLNASLAIMPGLLAVQMRVGSIETTTALVLAQLVLSAVYVGGGVLSQLIGRRTYLLGSSLCAVTIGMFCYYMLLTSIPGDLPRILIWTTLTTVFVIAPGALGTVYINERFRTTVRASGFGLGYSLAIILPAFYVFYQTWLAYLMPFKFTVLVLVAVGAVLVFVGAAWGPETKDVDFGPTADEVS